MHKDGSNQPEVQCKIKKQITDHRFFYRFFCYHIRRLFIISLAHLLKSDFALKKNGENKVYSINQSFNQQINQTQFMWSSFKCSIKTDIDQSYKPRIKTPTHTVQNKLINVHKQKLQ